MCSNGYVLTRERECTMNSEVWVFTKSIDNSIPFILLFSLSEILISFFSFCSCGPHTKVSQSRQSCLVCVLFWIIILSISFHHLSQYVYTWFSNWGLLSSKKLHLVLAVHWIQFTVRTIEHRMTTMKVHNEQVHKLQIQTMKQVLGANIKQLNHDLQSLLKHTPKQVRT